MLFNNLVSQDYNIHLIKMPPHEQNYLDDIAVRYQLPRRRLTPQEQEEMNNRFIAQLRIIDREFLRQREERDRQRRRQTLVRDDDPVLYDLLNFEIREEPVITFEGAAIAIPPPARLQRQRTGRVTPAQNQQNIQNQQNQPPQPPRFL